MKNEIEKNWDEMSKAYEYFTEDDDSYSDTIEWPCIQKMLPQLNNKRILDLGCGTGRFSFLFEKVEEPFPPESWKQNCYGRYNAFIETPSYMILRLSK